MRGTCDPEFWPKIWAKERANVIAPIKRAPVTVVRCGGCKATGVEHKWNDRGDYLPTGNRCPSCGGTGAASDQK